MKPLAIPTQRRSREDWAEALARAGAVNALPSAFPLPARTSRTVEVKAAENEKRRRAVFMESYP